MFDLGWSEILVIAIVLIVVVGPKDLPKVLRSFGRTTAKLRTMAGEFRRQFDDALREAELDDVKTLVDDVRKLDPRNEIKKHLNPLQQVGRDIKKELDDTTRLMSSPEPSASTSAQPAEPLKAGPAPLAGEGSGDATPPLKAFEAAAGEARPAETAATSGAAPESSPAPVTAETKAKAPAKSGTAKRTASASATKAVGPKATKSAKSGTARTTAAKAAASDSKPSAASRSRKKNGSDTQ